jgi:hypothetical protein
MKTHQRDTGIKEVFNSQDARENGKAGVQTSVKGATKKAGEETVKKGTAKEIDNKVPKPN